MLEEAKALDTTSFQYGRLPAISLLLPNILPSFIFEEQSTLLDNINTRFIQTSAKFKWPLDKTRRTTGLMLYTYG